MYAPDNHVWGVVGYSGFNGQMNGKPLQFSQGMYRFKPDGSDFEFLTGSTNNTWGLGFSETFDAFGSTANNDPSFYMAIPNRYFTGVEGLPTGVSGQRPLGPGYQSLAAFYAVHPASRRTSGRWTCTAATRPRRAIISIPRARFPKEYWNRIAFITEPTAHLVGQGIIEKQGAGFVTRDGWNLMAGAEEWVAPVHAQVGPDGAVWVADWYNFISQHNPTPTGYSNGKGNAYETTLRDHMRGRIYRVSYAQRAGGEEVVAVEDDPAGLVAALVVRQHVLAADGAAPARRARAEGRRAAAARARPQPCRRRGRHQRRRVPRALDARRARRPGRPAGVRRTAPRPRALKHPAAGVRKAAAMVLPKTAESAAAIVDAGLLRDPDLHTRLAATLGAGRHAAGARRRRRAVRGQPRPENFTDRWLSRALFIAATRHRDSLADVYNADPAKLPVTDLPLPLRIGALKPDWRVPPAAELGAWQDMQRPGQLGIARASRLRRRRLVHAGRSTGAADSADATIALGRIGNTRGGVGQRPLGDPARRPAAAPRRRRRAAAARPATRCPPARSRPARTS